MFLKNKKFYAGILLITLFSVFGLLVNFKAQKVNSSATTSADVVAEKQFPTAPPIQAENKAVEDTFTAGQTIEINDDKTNGDVAAAGANVNISGDVRGYVLAAGANVNVNAPVGNDFWAAGANVIVNNRIADNAMIAGSSVVIEPIGGIGRDARIAASVADIKGNVSRDLKIAAADARISSEIGGNIEAYTENLTLNPGAVVRGNLTVYSPNAPNISPQAQVLGRIDYHQTENAQSNSNRFGGWFGNWFLTFLWIAVLGLVAVWFSPVWVNRAAEMLKTQTGKSFLVGLIVMNVAPVIFIILLVTIIGLPLAFLIASFAFAVCILSGAFVSYFVGELFTKQIRRWEKSNALKIVFGALIITFLMALPWVGGLVKLAVVFFGAGAFLLERRDLLGIMREQGLA